MSNMQNLPGNLYVISAPSGAGKSSLLRVLLEQDGRIELSISHTTRAPRGQEVNGVAYHFVDNATFDGMVERGEFFEWAHVHGNRYGTSRRAIEQRMAQGQDVILEIDYQGAFSIQSIFPHAILVFILPPSLAELRRRITGRGEDTEERIELRMRNAENEVAQAPKYDYVIINDSFEQALQDLRAVVHAQRLRFSTLCRDKADIIQALGLASPTPSPI